MTFHAKIQRKSRSESNVEESTPSQRGRPPISSQVIRVGGAIALPSMLREHGIDADALIAEVGLQAAAFDDPDNVIPFASLGRLVHLAAKRTRLSDLGLRACMKTGLAMLGTVGYLVANSATVGEGLVCLQSYLHLHDEGAAPCFRQEGSLAVLGYDVLDPDLLGAEQIVFGALAIAANLLREICGAGFALREVHFAYRAPSDTSAFSRTSPRLFASMPIATQWCLMRHSLSIRLSARTHFSMLSSPRNFARKSVLERAGLP